MNKSRWLSLLGLAARARKIVTGGNIVINEVRRKRVRLVLLSADASERTKKKVLDKCDHYNIPVQIVADRQTLGQAIGKKERVVIGITDDGFANKMIVYLQ